MKKHDLLTCNEISENEIKKKMNNELQRISTTQFTVNALKIKQKSD